MIMPQNRLITRGQTLMRSEVKESAVLELKKIKRKKRKSTV